MKDIIIGFSLLWLLPLSFLVILEINEIHRKLRYLKNRMDGLNDK